MASSSAAVPSTTTPSTTSTIVTPDTLITVKVAIDGSNRRFKLPLRDLNSQIFPEKLRSLLQIDPEQNLQFERFSDSSTSYIRLDPNAPGTYKQLYRAAKAKLKLRIKATVVEEPSSDTTGPSSAKDVKPTATSETSIVADSASQANVQPKDESLTPAPTEAAPVRKCSINRKDLPGIPMGDLARLCGANMTFRPKTDSVQLPPGSWQVYCNSCDQPMVDAHFHCSICDSGDYDLCETCVNAGKLCPGEGHWLIKRYIKNGKVVNSTTERAAPKNHISSAKQPEMPGAFANEAKPDIPEMPKAPEQVRTCNGCIRVLPENLLVTCKDCDDFDFCMPCHVEQKNGHHPGHTFGPVVQGTHISKMAQSLCSPGRNVEHFAFCDVCDKKIFGVRHKCLDCPDWDLCNDCVKDASTKHPGHRFVPAYETLALPRQNRTIHYGVYCDGPLCKDKLKQGYIKGVRYKCAICHDLDFCANCEAHPKNDHNVTHPFIKFKTAFDHVTTSTIHENASGKTLATMGDRFSPHYVINKTTVDNNNNTNNASNETLPPYTAVAPAKSSPTAKAAEAPKDATSSPSKTTSPGNLDLDARFVRDIVQDGSRFPPDFGFQQVWTLRNPGPHAWPAGCRVRHVGGDNMLNIRRSRVATVSELTHAMESEPTEEVIEPGREIDFPVCMRTPSAPGKYISYWRLQAPNGMPFGHKLWCDVEVRTDAPLPSQQSGNTTSSRALQPNFPAVAQAPPPPAAPYPPPQPTGHPYGAPPPVPPFGLYNHSRVIPMLGRPGYHRNHPRSEARASESNAASPMQPFSGALPHMRPGRPRPEMRSGEDRNRLDCMRPPFRPWYMDNNTKPPIPTLRPYSAVPNTSQQPAVQKSESFNQAPMAPAKIGEQNVHPRPRSSFPPLSHEASAGSSPIELPSLRAALPEEAYGPYALRSTDRKAAHAAAAAAAAAATTIPSPHQYIPGQVDKATEATSADMGKKSPDIRDYLVEKKSNDVQTNEEDVNSMQSSTMVFPKIEKDGSPASSTNLDNYRVTETGVLPTKGNTVPSTAATVAESETASSVHMNDDEDETFEDLAAAEVQFDDDASSQSEEDNGFLTDEEYDILDASDEEIMSNFGQGNN